MQQAIETSKIICNSCAAQSDAQAKFCSACGKSLQSPTLGKRSLLPVTLLSVIGATALYFGISTISPLLTGVAPTQAFTAPARSASHNSSMAGPLTVSPKIEELRSLLSAETGTNAQKLELAIELSSQATAQLPVRTELVEEAIALLLEVKAAEQDNTQARMLLADSYFSLQRFDLAIQEYQQIIDSGLGDKDGAQSKLASTYAFTGQFEKAIELLEKVLEKNPQNFQALAYLSIAYSQKGDTQSALDVGNRALSAAPSSEARQRFQKFFETLSPHKESIPSGSAAAQVVESIRSNPIAGPKFVSFEEEQGTLKLYFDNFPMQAMPPVAREKFLGNIKSLKGNIVEIQFIDNSTAQIMDTLK